MFFEGNELALGRYDDDKPRIILCTLIIPNLFGNSIQMHKVLKREMKEKFFNVLITSIKFKSFINYLQAIKDTFFFLVGDH